MINDLEQLDEKWLKTVLEEAEKTAALARVALSAKRYLNDIRDGFDNSPGACRNAVENGCADNIQVKTSK